MFPFFECLAALCSQSSSSRARLPKCLPKHLRSMGVASVLSLLWLLPSGASLHLSPPRGALETSEGSNFSAPEGGKLLADERGITLTPEGGTLSYAPEGGKFLLPASFVSCGAARFDSCGGVQQTWPFLCFCYGIPPLLTLCKNWAVMVHVLLLYCLTHCCRDLKKERVRLKCLPRSTGHEPTILKCSVAIVDVILLLVHVASWVLVCDASCILVRWLPLCVDATRWARLFPTMSSGKPFEFQLCHSVLLSH